MKKFIGLFCSLWLIVLLTNVVHAYTEREYSIYQDVINTPMSVPEEEALRRVGKKYEITAKEVKAIVDGVMQELYSGGSNSNKDKAQKVEEALGGDIKIKNVIVSSDFANVSYIQTGGAWDTEDVKKKVLKGMPEILESIFTVQGIERARLTAFFPTVDGSDKKVAEVECLKSDFNTNKAVDKYHLTVYPSQ
jgi:hypothetical protein